MKIGPAKFNPEIRGFEVEIEGHRFFNGEKYTFVEQGWAIYLAHGELPEGWLRTWGETKPEEEDWSEIVSGGNMLVTSHPVLVALMILAHHHACGDAPIPTAPDIPIPSWGEAVEIVRTRRIENDFNQCYAGQVPGLRRWSPGGEQLL